MLLRRIGLLELGATEVVSEEFGGHDRVGDPYPGRLQPAPGSGGQRDPQHPESAYGLFRLARSTVPRLRLSSEIEVFMETVEIARDSPICKRSIGEVRVRQVWGRLNSGHYP